MCVFNLHLGDALIRSAYLVTCGRGDLGGRAIACNMPGTLCSKPISAKECNHCVCASHEKAQLRFLCLAVTTNQRSTRTAEIQLTFTLTTLIGASFVRAIRQPVDVNVWDFRVGDCCVACNGLQRVLLTVVVWHT